MTAATWHKYGEYAERAGPYLMVITKAGSANLFGPGTACCAYPDIKMRITVAGALATFAAEPAFCPTKPTKGTYRWKVSGRSLTLKLVKDKCSQPRVILFTTGPWKRK